MVVFTYPVTRVHHPERSFYSRFSQTTGDEHVSSVMYFTGPEARSDAKRRQTLRTIARAAITIMTWIILGMLCEYLLLPWQASYRSAPANRAAESISPST